MSMFKQFRTSKTAEKAGVIFDYGSFRVRLARMADSNPEFAKAMERKMRPHRRADRAGMLHADKKAALVREVFAEAVVLDWEVCKDDTLPLDKREYEQGIEGEDGKLQPFNYETVLATLKELPDLFNALLGDATDREAFLAEQAEEDAKN